MMNQDFESLLRKSATEVVPLDAKRSDRILANALRERRKGTPSIGFWNRPWVVATGAVAFGLIAYVQVYLPGPQALPPLVKSTPTAFLPTMAGQPEKIGEKSHHEERETQRASHPKMVRPLPSLLPKTRKPEVMIAQYPRKLNRVVMEKIAPQQNNRPALEDKPSMPTPVEDEGAMYVAVSGVNQPNTESDEGLKVAVTENVPNSVPGHAEAAGLQTVPIPGAPPTPGATTTIPVWTHVRVKTGEEPVMTLTAL